MEDSQERGKKSILRESPSQKSITINEVTPKTKKKPVKIMEKSDDEADNEVSTITKKQKAAK